MKIVFLNIYQGWVDRGAETFVAELSKRLGVTHSVKIISGDKKISSKRWPFLWRFFLDLQGIQICLFTLKNLPFLWREKPDIVVPVNGGWMPAIVRVVTWLLGRKMVISGHSGIGWDDRNNLWCFPDVFIALSSTALQWAKRANPFVKVEYIPNGVDIKKFTSNGEKLKINLKKPIVLCVGALTKTKRIELAIKAVAKLKDVSLLVCGDGDLREEIFKLGKKLLRERFELMKMSFEDMPKVYRAASVFTLVSEPHYSFETVLTEAMASGLPVIVNNDPIRKEIVGDAGILVDPTNTDEYSKALKTALIKSWEDKPRKQAEKFSWDKIGIEYERLFTKIILNKAQ